MENNNQHGRVPDRSAETGGTSTQQRQGRTISRKFPRPSDDTVLVATVGGVGQIGMNWTLYGHAGKWILVDAGSGFAPKDVEGVDAIFPDPRSLRAVLPNLEALVVTHAHEDHIGAIHRLWPEIKAPIVASEFAAHVLGHRFRERNARGKVDLRSFKPGESFKIGPFDIQTVRMTHSVPECVSLAIKTKAGTVLHTGDWKLDASPVIGEPTDLAALKALGDRGVLAMVCDSTNAERPAKRTSESDVAEGFKEVFKAAKGMVAVSCFASNVARMASVARAAAATGRRVALAGRSMLRMEEAARECGLLEGVPRFLDIRQVKGVARRETVILCTGTQGEERAALSKLAAGDDWKLPEVKPGDVIVHSARAIPGNEEAIETVLSKLEEKGATVLRGEFNGHPLHVTGHATSEEIATVYGLVRPKFSVPVHGESSHLEAHAKIARDAGVLDVAMMAEGDVLRVSRRRVERIAAVEIGLLAALSTESNVPRHVTWDPVAQEAVVPAKLAAKIERSEAQHRAQQRNRRGGQRRREREVRPQRAA